MWGRLTLRRPTTSFIRPRFPKCNSLYILQRDITKYLSNHQWLPLINSLVSRRSCRNGMLDSQCSHRIVFLVIYMSWYIQNKMSRSTATATKYTVEHTYPAWYLSHTRATGLIFWRTNYIASWLDRIWILFLGVWECQTSSFGRSGFKQDENVENVERRRNCWVYNLG